MTVATRPTTRARYAARRDAILAAACKVFIDQGVAGFTLAAVAKRMDLHPVSLTYYFKRKEDLAAECMRLTLSRFNAMLEIAEQEATPQNRLRAFVGAYFETRRGSFWARRRGCCPLARSAISPPLRMTSWWRPIAPCASGWPVCCAPPTRPG